MNCHCRELKLPSGITLGWWQAGQIIMLYMAYTAGHVHDAVMAWQLDSGDLLSDWTSSVLSFQTMVMYMCAWGYKYMYSHIYCMYIIVALCNFTYDVISYAAVIHG